MNRSALQFAQAFGHEATDKRLDILKRIGEVGSISEAARGAQVSYKGAWQALETLSNLAGTPLVEKAVGGSGGGGARLTQAGVQLLEAAELLYQARASVLAALEKRMGNTLNVPGLVGLGLRTSMRNQLPCRIKTLTRDGGTARIQLELPNGTVLISRITNESAELLGLSAGLSVLALCKATAVTVGTGLDGPESLNLIDGEVLSAPSSLNSGETSVALMPGLQLIGFALAGQCLSAGQSVVAAVDESAVVIAIPG
ncbi:MAG: LysR family transcriptional regulator [Betaproteobacteria bacterium]|nr:LysR family transcriptional regulator [Betaproteobacteria bacterium]